MPDEFKIIDGAEDVAKAVFDELEKSRERITKKRACTTMFDAALSEIYMVRASHHQNPSHVDEVYTLLDTIITKCQELLDVMRND